MTLLSAVLSHFKSRAHALRFTRARLVTQVACSVAIGAILLPSCERGTGPAAHKRPTQVEVLDDLPASVEVGDMVTVRVFVGDGSGAGVAGIQGSIKVIDGGGAVRSPQLTTDAEGIGTVQWTIGTVAGPNVLEIAVADLDPLTLQVLGLAGPPEHLFWLTVPAALQRNRTAFDPIPVIQLQDRFDNVSETDSVSVTASVSTDLVQITGASVRRSDTTGVVRFADFAIRGLAGSYDLTFTGPGLDTLSAQVTLREGPPTFLLTVAGDHQTGQVGRSVSTSPRVRVVDADSNGTPGQHVVFVAMDGSDVGQGSVDTDSAGFASASWTLGQKPGSYTLVARAASLPADSIIFVASAVAGPAHDLVEVAGNNQTARVGAPVAIPPQVRVTDVYGNGIPGIAVTFSVVEGGGEVATAPNPSDADGNVGVVWWTLGAQAGTNRLSATAPGLVGSPIMFSATGIAGDANGLRLITAPSDSARGDVPFSRQPVVQLIDVDSNAVAESGESVTVSLISGAGQLIGSTVALTDSTGVAKFANLGIDGPAGMFVLRFTSSTERSTVANVAVTVGSARKIKIRRGDNQRTPAGTPVPVIPSVTVTDVIGQPVSGVPVAFTVESGGGSVTGDTVITSFDGSAEPRSWVLGSGAGWNTLRASIGAFGGVLFTARAAVPSALELNEWPGSVRSRVQLDTSPVLRVLDQDGFPFPVRDIQVTASASDDITLLGSSVEVTDSVGYVEFRGLTLAGPAGPHTLKFSTPGLDTVFASVALTAGEPSSVVLVRGADQHGVAGMSVPVAPSIRVTDADGNPVAGVAVAFVVRSGGGSLINPATLTDADGSASAGTWILGNTGDADTLRVTVNGLENSPVDVGAIAVYKTPDLQPRNGLISGSILSGRVNDFTYEIVNYGDSTAQGYVVGYYASRDSTITTSDVAIGARSAGSLPSIAPGATLAVSDSVVIPSDVFGLYYIGIIVNADSAILEPVYSNNVWHEEYFITRVTGPFSIVGVGGAGSGRITSSPHGIDCRFQNGVPAQSGCSAEIGSDANTVILTVAPDSGTQFLGFVRHPEISFSASGATGTSSAYGALGGYEGDLQPCAGYRSLGWRDANVCPVGIFDGRPIGAAWLAPPVVPFREDFADGQFSASPPWIPTFTSDIAGTYEVVNNDYLRIASTNDSWLWTQTDVAVTDLTRLNIDVRIVSNRFAVHDQFPADVILTVRNSDGSITDAHFAFATISPNPPPNSASETWLVTPAPLGTWLRDVHLNVRAAAPDAERILEVRVGGFNSAGFESWFDNLRIDEGLAPPSAPGPLTVTQSTDAEFQLEWKDNSSNETTFELERSIGTNGFGLIATFPAGTHAYADGGLALNTTYNYRVRACNDTGCSPYSNETGLTLFETLSSGSRRSVTLASGNARWYRFVPPAGQDLLWASLSGGSGDADLFVTQAGSIVCSSRGLSSDEVCNVATPAAVEYLIGVTAETAIDGVELEVGVKKDAAGFDAQTTYLGSSWTAQVVLAIDGALDRWNNVITDDVPPVMVNSAYTWDGETTVIRRLIDDLHIIVSVAPSSDGVGGTVAEAAIAAVRNDFTRGAPQGHLPVVAWIRFDAADLADMPTATLERVALHEIGHALGIGTLWDIAPLDLIQGTATDPYHVGTATRGQFAIVGGGRVHG